MARSLFFLLSRLLQASSGLPNLHTLAKRLRTNGTKRTNALWRYGTAERTRPYVPASTRALGSLIYASAPSAANGQYRLHYRTRCRCCSSRQTHKFWRSNGAAHWPVDHAPTVRLRFNANFGSRFLRDATQLVCSRGGSRCSAGTW